MIFSRIQSVSHSLSLSQTLSVLIREELPKAPLKHLALPLPLPCSSLPLEEQAAHWPQRVTEQLLPQLEADPQTCFRGGTGEFAGVLGAGAPGPGNTR